MRMTKSLLGAPSWKLESVLTQCLNEFDHKIDSGPVMFALGWWLYVMKFLKMSSSLSLSWWKARAFFFEWSRKLIERVGQSWPELNTFQVDVDSIGPRCVYSSFTDFVFHILATKTSRHPDLWNLAPKRGTTSEPHACVPHTKNQILPSCKICRSWDQGDWIAKIGSIWKNHEGDVKSESASLGNLS